MASIKKRVLILDGMWNKSLAAVRSFGRKGFYVAAGERTRLATALFSKYCARTFVYPSPTEKKEDFLECLEDELKEGDYDIVLPMELSTQMVLTDTLVRRRLCQFTRIPFADSSLAEKVNDKSFLMKYAETMKIRKPKTYFPDGMEQVADIAHKLQYPVLIKPRASSGSRGIVYVNDEKDLPSSFAKVHKNYPSPIIQEYIPRGGGAFGVGLLLNFASEVKASFVYKRIREYPVQGGPSTLRESVQRQDIREIAESLLISLRWIGIAHVEFTIDPRDEKPKLLEVNPRFWGSLSLAIEAGVDFPYLLYRMAMEGDIDPVRDYRLGVQCRWLIPGDILHFIKNPNRFRLKPSFFDFSAKDDIISRHDFFPVIGRLSSALTFFFDKEMKELLKR